jgi:FkbM family methyltransferase
MTLYVYKEIFVDGCYDQPKLPDVRPQIIDVGANTGLFTIRIKQLYPQAHVHCYEPVPTNFEQLLANLETNSLRDCVTIQEGIGGTTRTEKLFIHKRNVGGHSIYAKVAASGESIQIHLIAIAEALARLPGKTCSLLKLDCEGAEYEIIKSIDPSLAARIDHLIFEPTPSVYDINELKRHLDQIGYDVSWNAGIYVATRRDLFVQNAVQSGGLVGNLKKG